jgi:DNA-binding transcriptional LysR family regulator
MNMNIKRLAYFLEISKTLNITKAAENLHISQPPLTAQLKLLEEELGTVLFIRTTRKLEITEAGEKLKSRASKMK